MWSILGHGEICNTAEATQGHHACVHPVLGGRKLAAPGATTEPQGLNSQKHNPDWLIFSLPLLSLDGARLWTYVWHLPTQQRPKGTQHQQLSIVQSRTADEKSQTFGLTASSVVPGLDSGRPTSGRIHTADIASCRNGQQMSATALKHKWKHEIQGALLRRRAAMTQGVLPNTSAREQWLLAGLRDRATNHWILPRPLDGGEDEDIGTGHDCARR